MEPAASCKDTLCAPVLGRDETVEMQLSCSKGTSACPAAPLRHLLYFQKHLYSQWPVLFLNVGVGGRGSGTQKEVTANQVFRAPCPPEHLSLLGEVDESTKGESTSGCSRQGSPEPGDGTLNSRNKTTAGLGNATGLAISALDRAEEKGLFLSPCVW